MIVNQEVTIRQKRIGNGLETTELHHSAHFQ